MRRTRPEAERALAMLRLILAERGAKETKTRIVELGDGGEGLEILGFEHR